LWGFPALALRARRLSPARHSFCQIIREEIRRNPGQGEDTYQRGKVWYARLTAGDLMLPVRMEFETAFGTVRGYLAELRGHGVHLHLMRE
jgi:hypothetical protein